MEEAAHNKAVLEEEIRFWKIEALRAASEQDSMVQHLERLVHRRPIAPATAVPPAAPGSMEAGSQDDSAARIGAGMEARAQWAAKEQAIKFGPVGVDAVHDAQTRALLNARSPLHEASRQVFAAQLQLVRSQISRAKMRAETMARRYPVGGALQDGGVREYAPGVEQTWIEFKLNAARPRVRTFQEALDQVRSCDALGIAV